MDSPSTPPDTLATQAHLDNLATLHNRFKDAPNPEGYKLYIEVIVEQLNGVSPEEAAAALVEAEGDVVTALIELSVD